MATDLYTDPIHLAPGGVARILEGFGWDPVALARYADDTSADGADGRLVMMFRAEGTGGQWERHPLGDEVVVAIDGRHVFRQQTAAGEVIVEIGPGQALINPAGVWHTASSPEPGTLLTITPGLHTEHRPAASR